MADISGEKYNLEDDSRCAGAWRSLVLRYIRVPSDMFPNDMAYARTVLAEHNAV